MSAVTGFFNAFGYHTEDFGGMESYARANIGKAVGYIPVVGLAVGVMRIVRAVTMMRESPVNRAFKIGRIVRGILETLCLGLVVGLLIDLPVTIVRHINCGRRLDCEVVEPTLE